MDRLNYLLENLRDVKSFADIGCDHGKLGYDLIKNGLIEKLILTDISADCLNKAKMLFKKMGNNVSFRCGDGIKVVEPFEVEALVISGMGAELIYNILNFDINKTKSFRKILLQPMTKPDLIRQFAIEKNINIVDDAIVSEGRKFYNVIILDTTKSYNGEEEIFFPKFLKACTKEDVFKSYVEHNIKKLENINKKISENSSNTEEIYKNNLLLEKWRKY